MRSNVGGYGWVALYAARLRFLVFGWTRALDIVKSCRRSDEAEIQELKVSSFDMKARKPYPIFIYAQLY